MRVTVHLLALIEACAPCVKANRNVHDLHQPPTEILAAVFVSPLAWP
jgi:hypothetical protein